MRPAKGHIACFSEQCVIAEDVVLRKPCPPRCREIRRQARFLAFCVFCAPAQVAFLTECSLENNQTAEQAYV